MNIRKIINYAFQSHGIRANDTVEAVVVKYSSRYHMPCKLRIDLKGSDYSLFVVLYNVYKNEPDVDRIMIFNNIFPLRLLDNGNPSELDELLNNDIENIEMYITKADERDPISV